MSIRTNDVRAILRRFNGTPPMVAAITMPAYSPCWPTDSAPPATLRELVTTFLYTLLAALAVGRVHGQRGGYGTNQRATAIDTAVRHGRRNIRSGDDPHAVPPRPALPGLVAGVAGAPSWH